MKRTNGAGTVYKMKHAALRRPYRAIVTTGYGDEGRQMRKTIGYYTTAREAWRALEAYAGNEDLARHAGTTWKDAVDAFVASRRKAGVSESRMRMFGTVFSKFTGIAGRSLQDIRAVHLQAVLDSLEVKASTYNLYRGILVSLYNYCIKLDMVAKNYADLISTTKPDGGPAKHRAFTLDELRTLWNHAGDRDVQLWLVYIYTGLRARELLTARLENIHLDESYMVAGLKTKAGRDRIVPIADCIRPFVVDLITRARFAGSEVIERRTYITISSHLTGVLPEIGIAAHTLHDARHTFISLCATSGIPASYIKRMVGHVGGNITDDVYTHFEPSVLVDAVNKLPAGDALSEATKKEAR